MKQVWSPGTASKAYIDTVKSCELHNESGVAELVSAMAAGWNARFIVETWSKGGAMATSIGLAVASKYAAALEEAGMSAEAIVGEPEEVMKGLNGIDFMVVDSQRNDFSKILKLAKLSDRGAVLACKNAHPKTASTFRWKSVVDERSYRVVRCVFLPVGKGLDIAHVASSGGNSGEAERRWIKHVDPQSGEEHVIRR
ncbi:hypothetical protein Goklo_014555 [Gossypium klotzschianum]|uniref:Uncharacterized protein n=1 Tax=Gossypium klotzschianum TaxID=34286 RepID=A0A7J8U837_9ROSI|nr:hypothetical protein [Gossypium klotzschianum]